ncbi:DMT family transporter [Engelhardtia mirabilis]|uniref:Putative DMT superfamily transporter inner membrane protein n=1 Tax=Engelhardtia mirabilis TaxID=2528011 RepID=A0A518BKV4_9BACT|nr:putative DMT superfamily transporter inner membrane protein [Planctomycetes bacterium Pla133]QDV01937.1 putative DMT superfamily transporter inner membrane protein [Planctomycetes bacterium Pla86]
MPDAVLGNSTAIAGAAAGMAAAAGWALASHQFARALRGKSHAGPVAANLFKNTVALVVFACVWAAAGWAIPSTAAWGWLGLSGLFGFAIGDALYFAALPRCGVQLAAMSVNLIPPLAALLAFLFDGESLPPKALVAMSVALAGIALVVSDRGGSGNLATARDKRVGVSLASLAALSQAFAIVSGRRGFEGVDLLPGTVLRLVGGVAGAALIAIALGGLRGRGGMRRSLTQLVGGLGHRPTLLLLLPPILVGAVLNLPLHSLALGSLSPGVSAILFATTPLFALPIGLRMGERYGWRSAVGTALGFVGVVGVVLSTAA